LRLPRVQFTVRRMMVAVATLSVVTASAKLAGELRYWTWSYGWHTSVLPAGMGVSTCRDLTSDRVTIPAGTGCVVIADPPDEDSAYPDRKVGVRVSGGPNAGFALSVRRVVLRAR
jgi:hypothetical protein